MKHKTELENRSSKEQKPVKLLPLVTELIAQGRIEEAEEVVRFGKVMSSARCKYIHGRGWIPREVE